VFEGPGRIVVRDDLPRPRIESTQDAVVRVLAAGLCGSDLHPYEGREPARPGVVAGHEAAGEVVEVGDDVTGPAVGDRVVVPFTTSCGRCEPCRRGLTARCRDGQLFGWGDPDDLDAPALPGGQAELLRVPLAGSSLVAVPDHLDDVDAVLLADNLPTGWTAVERTGAVAGDALVVVGLGAVGLCAVWTGRRRGLDPIVAVDPVEGRRHRAAVLGATAVDPADAAAAVAALPLPARATVEAAGSPSGHRTAVELTAPGGTVSLISVPTGDRFGFAPASLYDRNLTVRAGRAPVRAVLDGLLPHLGADGWRLPTDEVVTHRNAVLDEGPELYRRFAAREDGLVKAAFRP
jgi:alcohol dehydrogenase